MSMTAALILLAGAGQASDPELGSRLKARPTYSQNYDERRSRETQYRYVECSVGRVEEAMRRILDSGMKDNYAKAFDQMERRRGCNFTGFVDEGERRLSFGSDEATMRGMIAEAVLKKHDALRPLPALPLKAVYQRPWHELTNRPAAVDEMATCVAEVAPDGIASVLATGHGSPEETQAIRGIAPSLGTCLGAGAKLTANRTAIRSALAEALYHRTFNAPPPGASQ